MSLQQATVARKTQVVRLLSLEEGNKKNMKEALLKSIASPTTNHSSLIPSQKIDEMR